MFFGTCKMAEKASDNVKRDIYLFFDYEWSNSLFYSVSLFPWANIIHHTTELETSVIHQNKAEFMQIFTS